MMEIILGIFEIPRDERRITHLVHICGFGITPGIPQAIAGAVRNGFPSYASRNDRAISRAAGVRNSDFFRLITRNVKLYRKIVVGVKFWRRLTGTGVN